MLADKRRYPEEMETAYIGLGANIAGPAGPPSATLTRAMERMCALGRVSRQSGLYSTAPWGYADQPRFVNAVAALETLLSARELLVGLLEIEREFGRDRSAGIRNGPRTLDLDILLFGEQRIESGALQVPHPRLVARAFVLVPLNEIAPDVVVPGLGATVSELLARLRAADIDAVQEIDK